MQYIYFQLIIIFPDMSLDIKKSCCPARILYFDQLMLMLSCRVLKCATLHRSTNSVGIRVASSSLVTTAGDSLLVGIG